MRQCGILAAACLYAMENNVERLALDHAKASRIAALVASKPALKLLFPVETNIVIFRVEDESIDFEGFTRALGEAGVLSLAFGNRSVRMVTHLDITDDDIDYVEKKLSRIC
jgi:threonine aldolase